jgi:gluconate 5-dehydrogenase
MMSQKTARQEEKKMNELFSLEDKNIILTGAEGHLGSAMRKGLLDCSANVVSVDIHCASAAAQDSEKHRYLQCDLSQPDAVRMLFREIHQSLGSIDVLINNAAYGGGAGGKGLSTDPENIDEQQWLAGIDGTLNVTYRCIREAVPCLRQGGSIINIASMYGIVSPDPGLYGDSGLNNPPMYGAGKAGVIQLSRYFAALLADRGIRVNAVSPGPFPGEKALAKIDFARRLADKTMLKRIGKPEELLGVIVLLASDASSFITGANIAVDGGWTAW